MIVWSDFLLKVYEWVLDIMQATGTVWSWLTTKIDILGFVKIEPIFLVGVAGIIAGIIKAIVA